MTTLLTINAIFSLLFLLYVVAFRRLTFFQSNRIYLLASLALSFLLPFLSWPSGTIASGLPITTIELPMIEVLASNEAVMLPAAKAAMFVYWIGVTVGIVLMVRAIIALRSIAAQANHDAVENYETSTGDHAFSFFQRVYIGSTIDPSLRKMILEHENIHRQQWHSLDVLLFSIARILCWFNPFMHWAAKEVQLNHEYIADEFLERVHGSDYQHGLLNHAFGTNVFPLTNSFYNESIIKQRIMKMNKTRTRTQLTVLYTLIVPVLIASIWITACTNEPAVPESAVTTTAQDAMKPRPKDVVYGPQDELDIMPAFPGGNEGLIAFFQEGFVYPQALKNEGIEGRVFIQFTVNQDGTHSDYEAVRVEVTSVAEGANPEEVDDARLVDPAIAFISTMPEWEPGLKEEVPVKVKMVLPVQYSLN